VIVTVCRADDAAPNAELGSLKSPLNEWVTSLDEYLAKAGMGLSNNYFRAVNFFPNRCEQFFVEGKW